MNKELKNIWICMFIVLLFIPISFGIKMCDYEVDANIDCQILTPEIVCDNYNLDIYNSSLELYKDNEVMSQISGGYYNYTFNEVSGSYFIVLCDNSSRQILVRDTIHSKLDILQSNVTDILVDTSSSIPAQIISVNDTLKAINDSIINRIDLVDSDVWSYSTREITGGNLTTQDWATLQNASDIRNDIANINTSDKTNYSRIDEIVLSINDSIIVHGDINWLTSTISDINYSKVSTPEQVISVNNTVKSESASIISHGDTYWTGISTSNITEIAYAVWDVNLSSRYPQANDDNYVANSAGEKMLQSLRFIIQQVFGW